MYIPYSCVSCKGIVRNIDPDITTGELEVNMRSNIRVRNIRRLNKKRKIDNEIVYTPTPTILVTFKGTSLPQNVEIYRLPFLVLSYISPVTQCYNCLIYEHTSTQCRSRTKCISGTDVYDKETFCDKIKCLSNDHKSIYRKCPKYLRQQEIKKYMHNSQDYPSLSSRPSTKISIPVNNKRVAHMQHLTKSKRSYSQATNNPPPQKKNTNFDKYFDYTSHNKCLIKPNGRDTSST